MEDPPDCDVVYAERLGGDVLIEFSDGEAALYSASLLRSIVDQATGLDEPDEPDEPSWPLRPRWTSE
jgi:hypothetical protein